MTTNIAAQMARGAVWMLLFKLVERTLGLISTLILVRLLVPADFGIVAMAMSFIFMAELLAAFGFDVALIQNQTATEAHYHSAWTGNVLLGAGITLLMLIAARPVADFYGETAVFWVVCSLSLGPLISGCENIGVVAFRKELQFRKEFAFQISRKLVAFAVTVPLAFWLRSYWALVAGMLVSRLAGMVISYLAHPFRPHLSMAELPSLLCFSKWLLVNNVVGFLKERFSDLVIGRMHGPAALGLYNVSYEFANLPTTELGAPINRALLPGFARMEEREAVRAAYVTATGMLALVAVPAAAGILAVAPFFVPVVLGPKWLGGVPLMEVLALNGAVLVFQGSICTILIARGRPAATTWTNALYVALLIACLLVFSVGTGPIGAAYAALAATTLSMPAYLYQLWRCTYIPATVFLHAVARPALASLVMVSVVRWALPTYSSSMSMAHASGLLLAGVALGAATYLLTVLLLWFAAGRPIGPEQLVLYRVRSVLGRISGLARVQFTRFLGANR